MLVAFSVAPSTADPSGSVSEAVAAAVRVVRASGLPCSTDAMFTTLEGSWEDCMAVVKAACDVVGTYGDRVSLVLKADIRPGFDGQLGAKVARIEQILSRDDGSPGSAEPSDPSVVPVAPSGPGSAGPLVLPRP